MDLRIESIFLLIISYTIPASLVFLKIVITNSA